MKSPPPPTPYPPYPLPPILLRLIPSDNSNFLIEKKEIKRLHKCQNSNFFHFHKFFTKERYKFWLSR